MPTLFLPGLKCCDMDGWRGLKAWMPGRRPRMVIPMFGSPAGFIAVVVAMSLGRGGGEGCSTGGSGMVFLCSSRCSWGPLAGTGELPGESPALRRRRQRRPCTSFSS